MSCNQWCRRSCEPRPDSITGVPAVMAEGQGGLLDVVLDPAFATNPAPGNPTCAPAGAHAEIFSLGHRNPLGSALHPDTGELWSSEHGAQGGDEVNRVLPGRNYGWPLASHSQEYNTTTPVGPTSMAGMESPLQGLDGALYLLTDNGKLLRYGP